MPVMNAPATNRLRAHFYCMEPNARNEQMAVSKGLIAVDVHTDDVGDYNVTEPGWYAVDDADKVVLGPFASLAECERAIGDRKRLMGAKA
jgi:hypothetical protein